MNINLRIVNALSTNVDGKFGFFQGKRAAFILKQLIKMVFPGKVLVQHYSGYGFNQIRVRLLTGQ